MTQCNHPNPIVYLRTLTSGCRFHAPSYSLPEAIYSQIFDQRFHMERAVWEPFERERCTAVWSPDMPSADVSIEDPA